MKKTKTNHLAKGRRDIPGFETMFIVLSKYYEG